MRNCDETRQWLDAYLDNELDPVNTVEIEQHLQACAACSQAYEELRALREALSALPRYPAPAALRERVHSALRAEADEHVQTIPFVPAARPAWRWVTALAAMLVLGAVFAGALLFSRHQPADPNQMLAREVIASHIRSLMVSHLADVASTDQHTVKPWFDGKLNFAPPVVDFARNGFPLVGGRLDYLTDGPIAAVVYRRDKHVINLFVRPASGTEQGKFPKTASRQGYNCLSWIQAGTRYWAVSDLTPAELQQFMELVRRATPS